MNPTEPVNEDELHLVIDDEILPQQTITAAVDTFDWEEELKKHRDNNAHLSKEFEQLGEEVRPSNDEIVVMDEELSDEDRLAYERAKAQWDSVQLLREHQHYGEESSKVTEIDNREVNISFDEAMKYFKSLNLGKENDLAKEQLNTSSDGKSLFQKLFSCFSTESDEVQTEKIFLVALTNIPLSHEIEEHDRILFTLYKKITGDKQNCPSVGPHWEAIGFQGNDPKTDLRGVGMLGLIQLLFFIYSDERTLRDIYALSHTQNFPMAVVSLNITQIVLRLLLDGKLARSISKYGSVFDALNIAYSSLFYQFYLTWKRGQKNITDFDAVKKNLTADANKMLPTLIQDYSNMVVKRETIPTEKKEVIEFK